MQARLWERLATSVLLVCGVALVAVVPLITHAADLIFSPSSGSFPADQQFSVTVMLDPGSDSVNASDGNIIFDRDVFQVVSVSKEGSGFSLWTADPTFSNTDGTITFSGGTPSAFSKKSSVITITMKGKKTGSGKISVTKGSVLAADGKGTDVYKTGGEANFDITEAAAAPPPDTDSGDTGDLAGGPVPLAPDITASSYAKQEEWHTASSSLFYWRLTPDILGVRMLYADKPDAVPTQKLKATATSTFVGGITDGVHYLLVQLQNDSGWGAVGSFKIQVDTVPPTDFDIALVEGDGKATPAKLSFKAEDALSGMDRYELLLGSTSVATVSAADLTDGAYPVPPQEGGPAKVVIRAYDKAGNVREVAKQFTLPKVAKPVAKSADGDTPAPSSGSLWERILLIIFALIIGALSGWMYYSRKGAEAEHSKLLHRVAEVADKTDRVFSAMREEFEQMVNDFDPKPQLTPEERDFLEQIKEVIDLSEEVIDTEIEELKKMMRGQ